MKIALTLCAFILTAFHTEVAWTQTTQPLAATSALSAPPEALRIDLQAEDAPTTGRLARAYVITQEAEFVPGQLGDTFLGDVALETDHLRAVIARPDKPAQGFVRGGTLMDITVGGKGVDYLGGINTSVQPETTAAVAIYTSVKPENDPQGNSAAVLLQGYIGDPGNPTPANDEKIDVNTRISVSRGTATLELVSTFKNSSSRTAWLMPADVADWGEMSAFAEGAGFNTTTATSGLIIASRDDFALAYHTAGPVAVHGLHAGRYSLLLANRAGIDLDRFKATYETPTINTRDSMPEDLRRAGGATAPGPGMMIFPGTETRYIAGPNGLPMNQPIYIPKSRLKYVDGAPTVTLTMGSVNQLFEKPANPANYVELKPGESYRFHRYLRVGNANWARLAQDAYREKHETLGLLIGAVIEANTTRRISDAKVRISGGPNWDGTGVAPAWVQTTTRHNGTFVAKVPPGKYRLEADATGHKQLVETAPITVAAGTDPTLSVLLMSQQSGLRVAISEAETPTSSPLPVKLTIISKPPYPTENYGFTPDIKPGVRNVQYLPHGAAVVPLSPGRYRLVISRGIEYDTLEKDITVAPGQTVTLRDVLPHVAKPHLPPMVSMDAGVLTDASGTGYANAESRVVQAACEGVQVLISGDYDQATNLQAAIDDLKLNKWVRAFAGRRVLLSQDGLTADLFVYPLTDETSATLEKTLQTVKDLPPDVAIADIKAALPNVILEIARPLHPEAGYLASFGFDKSKRRFTGVMPPPDFNAIQLVEGKKQGQEFDTYPRYIALQLDRLRKNSLGKAAPVSATGASNSRLPYGEEVGYLRTYLYLNSAKTLEQLTETDIISAVRGQHFLVTNGPILLFKALNRRSDKFEVRPGDILDSRTTDIVALSVRVVAAPWVGLNGWATRENGDIGLMSPVIEQTQEVLRYPTHGKGKGVQYHTRYLKQDAVLDAIAYGRYQNLEPVVPNPLKDFGGELFPMAWSGPIFVDRDGDGKITLPEKEQ